MLSSFVLRVKLKSEYGVKFSELSPVVKMSKYISFFAYRPYLAETGYNGKLRAFCMMNLRSDYARCFDYYIQNRITHELIYPFMLDADQNVSDPENNENYADLPAHFERYVEDGKAADFSDYEIDRVRKVLAIIEENGINIHALVKLSNKRLAKTCIRDYYKYFDCRAEKNTSKLLKFKIIIAIVFAVAVLYMIN